MLAKRANDDPLCINVKQLKPQFVTARSILEFIEVEQTDIDSLIDNPDDLAVLNEMKGIFCEFTALVKQELKEDNYIEVAMIKQSITRASSPLDLKEALQKLNTLIKSVVHEIQPKEAMASVSAKEKLEQLKKQGDSHEPPSFKPG